MDLRLHYGHRLEKIHELDAIGLVDGELRRIDVLVSEPGVQNGMYPEAAADPLRGARGLRVHTSHGRHAGNLHRRCSRPPNAPMDAFEGDGGRRARQ